MKSHPVSKLLTSTRTLLGFSLALVAPTALGQTADLGSDGSDGAIDITSDTVMPLPDDGVINATTVNIAAGATLSFSYDGPLHRGAVLLATGDVVIDGTIDVSGEDGPIGDGGAAGPGGSPGSEPSLCHQSTQVATPVDTDRIERGREEDYVRLEGGQGGEGSGSNNFDQSAECCDNLGGGGGGGGGTLVLYSNTTISGSGTITAAGGAGGPAPTGGECYPNDTSEEVPGEDGADGTIRIAAPTIGFSGTVIAEHLRRDAFEFTGSFTRAVGTGRDLSDLDESVGSNLLAYPSVLPVATITAINGDPVDPSTTWMVPAGTSEPFIVTVHVDNCSTDQLEAGVYYKKRRSDGNRDRTTISNPTGNDDVDVEVSPNLTDDQGSAALYATARCDAP